MGKNEIRLRRHKMTTHGLERHRQYSTILERHERDRKLKRIQRAFTYFLLLAAFLLLLWWFTSWTSRRKTSNEPGLMEAASLISASA